MEASSPAQRYHVTASDRLRIYRKCFHDLDEQLVQLQEQGSGPGDADYALVQAEIRCLEELILLFTDINSILPSIASKFISGDDFDPSLPMAEGLNLSLVTDILMLSASSPWTVFVAERSQWQICYVSPSVKRIFGWKASDLLGVPAWDGCHAEDIVVLQRMLLLKEVPTSGNSLAYRRLRKDRTYTTVQSTGRAVGTRWFAWVEQETGSNGSANRSNDSTELPLSLPSRSSKGKQTELSRKVTISRPTLESDMNSRGWSNAARPASPLALIPGLEKSKLLRTKGNAPPEPSELSVDPQMNISVEEKVQATTDELSGNSGSDLTPAEKPKKGKASQGELLPSKSKAPNASSQGGGSIDDLNSLWGKKILLVEDDRINRTIAQKLLENMKCDVTVACNGKEALDILQDAPPLNQEEGKEIPAQFDLVLMDLLMPVMDGTKAVQYFRDWEAEQEPPRKRMTIFALTSNVSDGDMVKCAISGFDEFVSKPLTIDKLLDRLMHLKL